MFGLSVAKSHDLCIYLVLEFRPIQLIGLLNNHH